MLKGQNLVDLLDSDLTYVRPLCKHDDDPTFLDYDPSNYDWDFRDYLRSYLVKSGNQDLVLKFSDLNHVEDSFVLTYPSRLRTEAEVLKIADGKYGLPKLIGEYSNAENDLVGFSKTFLDGIILTAVDYDVLSDSQKEKMKSSLYVQQDFLAKKGIAGLDINPTNILYLPNKGVCTLFDFDKCGLEKNIGLERFDDLYVEDRDLINDVFRRPFDIYSDDYNEY